MAEMDEFDAGSLFYYGRFSAVESLLQTGAGGSVFLQYHFYLWFCFVSPFPRRDVSLYHGAWLPLPGSISRSPDGFYASPFRQELYAPHITFPPDICGQSDGLQHHADSP